MDDDEIFVLVAGAVLTLIATERWYWPLWRVRSLKRHNPCVLPLAFTPPLCLGVLWIVLRKGSDAQVRDAPEYLALFMLAGGAILGIVTAILPIILGVSVRDDALERRNVAAAVVVFGALLGTTIVFAGANVGSGPTIWTTFEPAALGIGTLLVLWTIHAALSGMPEAVAIDRDPASTIRAGAFHVASALLLARAVAGDWVSINDTALDFARDAWPVLVLLMVAIVLDWVCLRQPWRARRALRPALIILLIEMSLSAVAACLVTGHLQ